MGYQAKDHFHTPRKNKSKKRPKEQDLIEYADELASEEKSRHIRSNKYKRTNCEIYS